MGMHPLLERGWTSAHLLLAIVGTWLVATSPWVALFLDVPPSAGFIDVSHVWLGLAMLPLGLLHLYSCVHAGRWRQYYPWLAGNFAQIATDLKDLVRMKRPGSEGGGLFAAIEGLLLIALVATAATGALWYATQGSDAAMAWRGHHIIAARVFVGLFIAHIVAVALHWLDFVSG